MTTGINFILLDAARLKHEMGNARELNLNYLSLYHGRREMNLADVGPYLFAYDQGSAFATWYKQSGWGNSWGLLVNSTSGMEELLNHFQKFLLIKNEEGKELYFRYYDPRVLRIFLPSCDVQQLEEFFGQVQQFICEDEDPAFALIYTFNGARLVTSRVTATTIFPALVKPASSPELPKVIPVTTTKENEISIEIKAQRPARKFLD
jgi:hypothetical protein